MAEFLQSTLRSSVDQLPTDCDDDPLTRLVDQIQVATDDVDTRDECIIALEECLGEYLGTTPIITTPSLIAANHTQAIKNCTIDDVGDDNVINGCSRTLPPSIIIIIIVIIITITHMICSPAHLAARKGSTADPFRCHSIY